MELEMANTEILARANEIVNPHGLQAEIFEGINSVGVGGDQRTYTPVINLVGAYSDWELLGTLAREIANTLPINRVTYEITKQAHV